MSDPGVRRRQGWLCILGVMGERAPSAPGPAAGLSAPAALGFPLPSSTQGTSTHANTHRDPTLPMGAGLMVQPTRLAPRTSLRPCWGPSFRWWESGDGEALVIKMEGRKGLWTWIICLFSLIDVILKSRQAAGWWLGCEVLPRGVFKELQSKVSPK